MLIPFLSRWMSYSTCAITVLLFSHLVHQVVCEPKQTKSISELSPPYLQELRLSFSPLGAQGEFSWQIEMNCVKEVLWVALGTPLRGVHVRLVTLSPGAGNNRWNQLLWESVWLSGGAVYRRLAARLRPDTGLRQLSHSLSQRSPAELETCVCVHRERSAFITRSPLLQGLHMTLWIQWSLSTLLLDG